MTTSQKRASSLWMELETMEGRLNQLQALLLSTHGEAFDVFHSLADPLREAYLSHCAEFTEGLRKQAAELMERARQENLDAKAKG